METVYLSSAYLAPVGYYSALARAETVFIENWDSYEKQTYRNRCKIATANGEMTLSIPVEKPSGVKVLTRDVRISEHSDWQIHHWRSIESAYNSSPFFEYYKDDFLPFYEKKWDFLWDFNWQIQSKVLELLDINPNIQLTKEFQKSTDGTIIDLRNHFQSKIENKFIGTKTYYQVFENKFGFLPGLSIIDLLFNMGNESQIIL